MFIESRRVRSSKLCAYAPPGQYLAYGYRVKIAPVSFERQAVLTITVAGEDGLKYSVSLTDEDIAAINNVRSGTLYTEAP
jgi:hypothetical protein